MTFAPLAALLAAAALGLAACGGDDAAGEQPTGATSEEQQRRDAQVAFARCMREHGVDMPDPKPGQRGLTIQAKPGMDPQALDEASEACAELREEVAPELAPEQQEEFKQRALEHARCMREHGIDMPDPQFSAEGGARITMKKGEVDFEDPEFKAAQEACGTLMERKP